MTIIRFDTSVVAVHCERPGETRARYIRIGIYNNIIYVIVVLYMCRIIYIYTFCARDASIRTISFTRTWPAPPTIIHLAPANRVCIGPEIHFRGYTYVYIILYCVYATVDDDNNTHTHKTTCRRACRYVLYHICILCPDTVMWLKSYMTTSIIKACRGPL